MAIDSANTALRQRHLIALDSNIWRYLVDADAVELVHRAIRGTRVEIVILPAVLYETLRMSDGRVRQALLGAQTRQTWHRAMPEAFSEAEELRGAIAKYRPAWLLENPDLGDWHRLVADWRHGTWDRARRQPRLMSELIDVNGAGERLDTARDEARALSQESRRLRFSFGALNVNRMESWFEQPVRGWDGQRFETWRAEGLNLWSQVLSGPEYQTYSEWLLPWIRRTAWKDDAASWVTFWTKDVSAADLPRQWMRTSMTWLASTRKVTNGTPVDVQISTYLLDVTDFCTSDKVFVDCVEKLRPSSPAKLAHTHLLPGKSAAADALLELIDSASRMSTAVANLMRPALE